MIKEYLGLKDINMRDLILDSPDCGEQEHLTGLASMLRSFHCPKFLSDQLLAFSMYLFKETQAETVVMPTPLMLLTPQYCFEIVTLPPNLPEF